MTRPTNTRDPAGSAETTYSCPVCGTVHPQQSARYKNHVCHDCEPKARCCHDKPVYGFNTGLGGGFLAAHSTRGDEECEQTTADHRVWIEGTEYKMQEARFGGTVITPLFVYESIRSKVVWQQDGPRQFTSGVDTGVYRGNITEQRGPRRFLMREPSTWEWQVSNLHNRRVYKRGVERTETAAQEKVITELDAILAYEARA
jgi:hypothetical protein